MPWVSRLGSGRLVGSTLMVAHVVLASDGAMLDGWHEPVCVCIDDWGNGREGSQAEMDCGTHCYCCNE